MSRFSYTEAQGMAGIPGMLPFIPLTLLYTGDGIHITQLGRRSGAGGFWGNRERSAA